MNLRKLRLALIAYLLFDLFLGGHNGGFLPLSNMAAAQNSSNTPLLNSQSFGQGEYYVASYNYQTSVFSGSCAGGSTSCTVTVFKPFVVLPDKRSVLVFSVVAPITIGQGAQQETVTPSAVTSGCSQLNSGTGSAACSITFTAANIHGQGDLIQSGSFGLQEAINDAFSRGGGIVAIDQMWSIAGGTNSTITSAIPYSTVTVEDFRLGAGQQWQPAQTGTTVLAAPTTLTSSTVGFGINGANTTNGNYTGTSTYVVCIAYVDIAGEEGPCSATFSGLTAGTGSTNQIGIKAPAASAGAVGYTAYISLASGTYNLTYQVPITSTVCTLTKVETLTPACAVTNTTYGQAGSNAIVSALTVNTAPLHLLATTASTTSAYIGTPAGRTTYAYAPVGNLSTQGLIPIQQAFTVAPATATTVPSVVATIPLPIGQMNFPGRTLCVEGQATEASAGSTATVQNFEFLWDAAGSDTTGAPVIIGQLQLTATLVTANADNWSFHECFETTVSGSGATAGSIQPFGGQLISTYGAGVLGNAGTEVNVAAIASLNLAGTGGNTQRLHVVWLHTTGTDGAGVQVTGLRAWWQ